MLNKLLWCVVGCSLSLLSKMPQKITMLLLLILVLGKLGSFS